MNAGTGASAVLCVVGAAVADSRGATSGGMLGKLPLADCAATRVVEERACLLHMRWSRCMPARQSVASENIDVGSPRVDSAKASKIGGRVCPPWVL